MRYVYEQHVDDKVDKRSFQNSKLFTSNIFRIVHNYRSKAQIYKFTSDIIWILGVPPQDGVPLFRI